MNSVSNWPRRRWFWVIALLLGGQLALIFAVGDPAPTPPRRARPALWLWFADQETTNLAAIADPTLFALPHRRGFSGPAWLTVPPPARHRFGWTNEPRFLSLRMQELGAAFVQLMESTRSELVEASVLPAPAPLLPTAPLPALSHGHSTLRVEGDLEGRRLLTPMSLTNWPSSDLLADTVVQLVVDLYGRPISDTLLSSCGLPEADSYALQQARQMRFEPLTLKAASPTPPADRPTLGKLIFEWETVEK